MFDEFESIRSEFLINLTHPRGITGRWRRRKDLKSKTIFASTLKVETTLNSAYKIRRIFSRVSNVVDVVSIVIQCPVKRVATREVWAIPAIGETVSFMLKPSVLRILPANKTPGEGSGLKVDAPKNNL